MFVAWLKYAIYFCDWCICWFHKETFSKMESDAWLFLLTMYMYLCVQIWEMEIVTALGTFMESCSRMQIILKYSSHIKTSLNISSCVFLMLCLDSRNLVLFYQKEQTCLLIIFLCQNSSFLHIYSSAHVAYSDHSGYTDVILIHSQPLCPNKM